MPRKGYTSIGHGSLPDEYVAAIDLLVKDPKFVWEMRAKGVMRISRSLVIRMASIPYLKDWCNDIIRVAEVEGGEPWRLCTDKFVCIRER